jgi:hypothetical protein
MGLEESVNFLGGYRSKMNVGSGAFFISAVQRFRSQRVALCLFDSGHWKPRLDGRPFIMDAIRSKWAPFDQ